MALIPTHFLSPVTNSSTQSTMTRGRNFAPQNSASLPPEDVEAVFHDILHPSSSSSLSHVSGTPPEQSESSKAQSSSVNSFKVGASTIPDMIRGRWKLKEMLGEGAYGTVFSAQDKETGGTVAVKVEEMLGPDVDSLVTEFEVYSRLKLIEDHIVGLPRCLYYGHVGDLYNVLVIEKLGRSLGDLQRTCIDCRMSLKTIITLAAQGVRRLEHLHHIGYVHRDIKPDNMLVSEKDPTRMYVVDFGLAAKYVDDNGIHVPKGRCEMVGTPLYCSIHVHIGVRPSRRCDLESLGYSLVELARGTLPWRRGKSFHEIYRLKLETCLMDLCSGLGREFEEFFMYVRGLRYEERPDYKYLVDLFKRAMRRHGYSRDRVMDWC